MGKAFGVVSRYADHIKAFPLAFYEVKDVGGAWHPTLSGAIPMVSCFGDNRVAKVHPDWVQIGPDGMRGVRSERYFDWDTLCPTRPEVRSLALDWIRQATSDDGLGIRLDDVTYARDGFCQCPICMQSIKVQGLTFEAHRATILSQFVDEVRRFGSSPLYFTLFPDPYPGHLEQRFGLDLKALDALVDTYVVPIYDLAYATTYWVEVLASAFRERVAKPLFIELYGLSIPEEKLQKAALVAGTYADGIVIAYDTDLAKLKRIESAFRDYFGG